MQPSLPRSLPRSGLTTWPGTLQPTAWNYAFPVALYLVTMAAIALTHRRGRVLEIAGICAAVVSGIAASRAYLRVIQGRSTQLALRADTLAIGRSSLSRAALAHTLTRWVDPNYGTTVGSALMLRSGAELWIVGCKGAPPCVDPSAAPTVSRVHVTLDAVDFAALLAELERDRAPARSGAPVSTKGYVIELLPSPASARGILRALGTMAPLVVAFEVVGFLAIRIFHLPEVALVALSWLLALAGFGWLIAQQRRPKPVRYHLCLVGSSASLIDPRSSRVLSEAPLSELTAIRGSYVIHSRVGSFTHIVLRLSWPDARQITIGPTEQRHWPGPTAARRMRAPGLLIGPSDWDRLLEELGLAA